MCSKWSENPQGEGILVAVDENLEWLLPWWWSRLRSQSSLSVCFVDLGMSHYGRSFCLERGQLVDLSLQSRLFSSEEGVEKWELLFGKDVKKRRESWFKKPFAFLLTPFEKTLWLDIDCEVVKPLESLFEREGEIYLACESESTHERERTLETIGKGEVLYNSGVVLYHHGSPLLQKWADAILQEGDQFFSDQHVLSHLIQKLQYPVQPLEIEYNWRMAWGLNLHAVIVHWAGNWGKEFIRRYGGIADELHSILQF